MSCFRQPRRPVALPGRWAWAITVIVLFLWTAVGSAQSPAPGTPIVNRAVGRCDDGGGKPLTVTSNTVAVPLAGAPLLRIVKAASSDPVAPGADFTYTLRYENSGNVAATGVTVVDTLPAEVRLRSGSSGGVYDGANHTVTWHPGDLPAGAGKVLTVTVRAGAGFPVTTPLVNGAEVTCLEGVTAATTLTTRIGTAPNLLLEKSVASPLVSPGGVITYTLAYRNLGNQEARLVRITDPLPLGTAYVANSATPPGSLQGGVLTWDLGSVAAGSGGEVGFQARVSPLATPGQQISNTATLICPVQTTLSNTVLSTISAASLLVRKMVTPDPVRAGLNLTYTLEMENPGATPLTGVRLRDPLPLGTTFVAATGGGVYSVDRQEVEWNSTALDAGQQLAVTLTLQVNRDLAEGQAIVNTAMATSNETAPQTVSAIAHVQARTPGWVGFFNAAWQPTEGYLGGATVYLEVRDGDQNGDPTGVDTVLAVVRDPQSGDTETVLLSETGPDTGIFRNAGLPTTLATTGAGDGNLTVAPGSLIQATYTDLLDASPIATATATIATPALLLRKSVQPEPVRAGLNLTYTLEVENSGTVPLTGVLLRDPLPEGTTFVSADGGGVYTADTRQVAWNIGTLSVGQIRTLTLLLQVGRELSAGQLILNTATATSNETTPQTSSTVSLVSGRTPGEVAFLDAAGQPVYGYMSGDLVYLRVEDLDQNVTPTLAETILVLLQDLQSGDQESVLLTESGVNTGIFRGVGIPTSLTVTPAGDGTLTVLGDSRIQATYTDPLDAAPVSTATALIDPLGTVFDAVAGTPVAGTVVTLRYWDNLANLCDLTRLPVLPPGQINPAEVTGTDGRFAFPLVAAGDYCYQVTPPPGYLFPSVVPDAELPAGFTVGNGSRGEKFTLSIGDPPLIRDIPVDPPVGRLTLTKAANKTMAAVGDLIGYSLKLSNGGQVPIKNLTVTDRMPHGIQLLAGSSRLDGRPLPEPVAQGRRTFAWLVPDLGPGEELEISYRALVGPDSPRGDGINTAFAGGASLGRPITSNTATVKVKINGGVFTEKGTIVGKIFQDRDGNRVQEQAASPGQGRKPDEAGIANVVLYLEDGTRVISDGNGKYSLLGVPPGTHVLRVDETTLPPGLRLVPLNSRFMGDAASQFVEMQPGGLCQADFAVEQGAPDPPAAERAAVAPPSATEIPPDGPAAGTENRVVARGYEAHPGVAPTSAEAGRSRGENAGEVGAAASEAAFPAPVGKPAVRDWEEEIKTLPAELAFLSPTAGAVLLRERIRVVFRAPLEAEATLYLNGVVVAAKQLGRKIDYQPGRVTIYEYIDLHLNRGEANVLRAEIKDLFGIVRGNNEISVTTAGAPERIVITTDRPEAPADGAALIRVEVSSRDRHERIVPYAAVATVVLSAGEIVEPDADPQQEDFQILLQDGVGRFTIRAPRETGEAEVLVALEDRQETARIFFTPPLRDLFLVGTGEVTLGHGHGQGEYHFLTDDTWFDDGAFTGGRGAFFLKGRIFRDLLLTAAYDSHKEKQEELFRENDTNLDSEDKYPIYGDESKSGYEAVSADKLYLKLEKGRSSLLYGDYQTGLDETRLAAYNRAFTGGKFVLNTEKLKVTSFASYTDQTQVVDTLPGLGISGYYFLSRQPVLDGSERVVIETRDRNRPQSVLRRVEKARGSDYEIDYDRGAILFKEPIPSHDGEYNPLVIRVGYESKSPGDKYYIYGGRGAFRPFPGLEVGATGVIEEKSLGEGRLTGTDLTLTLPRRTLLKAEYAETTALFAEESLFAWRSASAWAVELESAPVERLHLAGYYRTLGNYFLNLSAVDAARGTTKYGVDGTYELRPETRFRGQFFDERDELNAMRHRLSSLAILSKYKKTSITGEISHESSSDNYTSLANPGQPGQFVISEETPRRATAAKVGIETELRPDLSLKLSHRQNLSPDSDHMSQAGLSYQLDRANRLYLREEYLKFQEREETRTLLGVETQLLKNTVAFNEYRLADGADGARNQNVLGLRNKFFLGKGLTGNLTGEYLKTVSGAQRSAEPDAVAGTLGLEYLANERLTVSARAEHRRELLDAGRTTSLGEVGMACKLLPDYSLLFRERYFTETAGTTGRHTTSRSLVGLAYRPLFSNRFNALSKMEYKHEANAAAIPSFREEAWIISGEGGWRATPRLQLTGKYAGKLVRDEDLSSYTELLAARFLYDLSARWDVGAEYRILNSHAVNSLYQGGYLEGGYRVIKNLWLSAGYSFDRFDADLAGDGYQGEGFYLKIRVKFDEKSFY